MAEKKRKKLPVVSVDKNPHPSKTRRSRKIAVASLSKRASGLGAADVMQGSAMNLFSFQLASDFLEKPQNLKEKRAVYRFLSNSDEFVSRALELKVAIPLSKTRLTIPDGRNQEKNEYILDFFEKMSKRIKLFERLMQIVYEYYLHGVCYIFAEDFDPETLLEKGEGEVSKMDQELADALSKEREELADGKELPVQKYDFNADYPGWNRILILPPDAVEVTTYPFSDKVDIKVIPPANNKTNENHEGDPQYGIPNEIKESMEHDGKIPLDTDPNTGSFVHVLKRGGSYYDDLGQSMLDPVLGTMIYREKLRQAQTSIASRHMTPIRVVWGENLSSFHVEDLRAQVDMALQDPDYSIIANYEINWQEFGSNDRLLDLTSEYEETEKRLMVALGFTSEILRGEGSYAGNRLNLEIINTEFMQLRQIISEFVEDYIFAPIARRKGFYEIDKFGNKKLLYPKLSFSRLALKDNQEVFGAMLDLYQKGAIPVSYVLDLFNIDTPSAFKEMRDDLFTPKDSTYNDFLRGIYTAAAEQMVQKTNVVDLIAQHLKNSGVKQVEQPQQQAEDPAQARFASTAKPAKSKK
jgi:hypothetical protein